MTNLQAIDLLKGLEQSLDDYCELNDEGKTAFRMAITALEVFGLSEQLPAAQPEQQWIPVSEGLPKKDGRYQVTRHDDVTNTEFIDILWYEENLWWNRHSTGDYAVTAWMPLPEPYRGGGAE